MIIVLKNNDFLKFEGDIKNLPPDVAGCPAIDCKYTGGGRYYYNRHLNFKGWTLDWYGNLQDCRQEVRNFLHPEEILEVVKNFNSWLEYDANQQDKKMERILSEKESLRRECLVLEKELDSLKEVVKDHLNTFKMIYDINNNGGSGSRKRVRELASRFVTVCEVCNLADCICE